MYVKRRPRGGVTFIFVTEGERYMYIYICEESISRRAFQIDYTERRKQQGRQKRKKQGQKGNRLSSEIKYKKIQDVLFMFENEKGRGLSEKKTIQKIRD